MRSETLAELISKIPLLEDPISWSVKGEVVLADSDCVRIANAIRAWIMEGKDWGESS